MFYKDVEDLLAQYFHPRSPLRKGVRSLQPLPESEGVQPVEIVMMENVRHSFHNWEIDLLLIGQYSSAVGTYGSERVIRHLFYNPSHTIHRPSPNKYVFNYNGHLYTKLSVVETTKGKLGLKPFLTALRVPPKE